MAEKNDPQTVTKFYFAASPFPATPQTESFCGIGTTEETRRRIKRSIERAEGPAIVIGGPGLGKSLLCNVIANDYRGQYQVALLSEGQIDTSLELLQAIMFQLDLPYRGQEEGELRLGLIDFLRPKVNSGDNGMLLIVDEAQALSWELLEEIRMISSIVRDGKPRVRTLLAGGPRLDENLADPRLASFSQRIAARCYLQAMSSGETGSYIRQQLQRVGAEPNDLIQDKAITTVHNACDGIPRLINQLMNHVLYFAETEAAEIITPEIVQSAWADLQQLPVPMQRSADKSAGSIVDFGELSVDADEPAFEFGELSDTTASTECIAAHEPESEALLTAEQEPTSELAPDVTIDCVGPTSDAVGDRFAYEAAGAVEFAPLDALAEACGSEPAIVTGNQSAAGDADSIFMVGSYDSSEEPEPTIPRLDQSSKPTVTIATGDGPRFRDFPVVRLCNSQSSESKACTARNTEQSADLGCQAAQTADELDPESVCFQQDFPPVINPELARQVSTDVELNNVTDEPVTSQAAFGTIDDTLWDTFSAADCLLNQAAAKELPEQETMQINAKDIKLKRYDPFGDGYEDEVVIDVDHPGSLTTPALCVSAGSQRTDDPQLPQLRSEPSEAGNDPPVEIEEALRAEVIAINQAAIDTTQDTVAETFSSNVARGHAAHAGGRPKAYQDIEIFDDRDLLIIEDEVQDAELTVSRTPSPTAIKTLDDLTTLFSRIRKG